MELQGYAEKDRLEILSKYIQHMSRTLNIRKFFNDNNRYFSIFILCFHSLTPGEDGTIARKAALSSGKGGKESGTALPDSAHAAVLALLDDLNTPSAVSELSGPLKIANDLLTTKAGRKVADRIQQVGMGNIHMYQ